MEYSPEIIKKCGERIKEQREKLGLSREELCNKISGTSYTENISYSTLERIEKGIGKKMPKLEYIRQLSVLFRVPEEYLLCEQESSKFGIEGMFEETMLKAKTYHTEVRLPYLKYLESIGIKYYIHPDIKEYISIDGSDYTFIPYETFEFFTKLIQEYARLLFTEYIKSDLHFEDCDKKKI